MGGFFISRFLFGVAVRLPRLAGSACFSSSASLLHPSAHTPSLLVRVLVGLRRTKGGVGSRGCPWRTMMSPRGWRRRPAAAHTEASRGSPPNPQPSSSSPGSQLPSWLHPSQPRLAAPGGASAESPRRPRRLRQKVMGLQKEMATRPSVLKCSCVAPESRSKAGLRCVFVFGPFKHSGVFRV